MRPSYLFPKQSEDLGALEGAFYARRRRRRLALHLHFCVWRSRTHYRGEGRRWDLSIGLQNAAICAMLFVYGRFWIITAFRAGPVPAGQLGGDKKLLSWTIPIEPSRSGEAQRNNTIDVGRPQARGSRQYDELGDRREVIIGQGCPLSWAVQRWKAFHVLYSLACIIMVQITGLNSKRSILMNEGFTQPTVWKLDSWSQCG